MNQKDYAELRKFTNQSSAYEIAAIGDDDALVDLSKSITGHATPGCIHENAMRVIENYYSSHANKVLALNLAIQYYINRTHAEDIIQVALAIANATGKPYSLNGP